MIHIYTQPNFLPEKEYTFHVIFREILGIDFTIHTSSVSGQYTFVLPNTAKIEFRDAFFSLYSESVGYCTTANFPSKITYFKDPTLKSEIPIIYGDNSFNEINSLSIYSGIDIIASSFFMLSRWEELAINEYDAQGRFPERLSLAVRHGFIKKPVVHMYAELIRNIAERLGYTIQPVHTFKKTVTHDIDYMFKWLNFSDYFKTCTGDLCKRFSFEAFKRNMAFRRIRKDPYDMFSELMDKSEKHDLVSMFYFLHDSRNAKALSTNRGKKIVDEILQRGHSVGVHFNHYTESHKDNIEGDKSFFESIFQTVITKSRQHFLRMQVPKTLKVLENAGIMQDSTLYYRNFPGFRTGMCIEHSLFDSIARKTLTIKELPLILMDVSLKNYKDAVEAQAIIDELITTTKKYNGNFVCLWHNSSFDWYEWQNISPLYAYIVEA